MSAEIGAYWTPDELAAKLRVKGGAVRAMCRKGLIKARRVGAKLWRIPDKEVRSKYPELFDVEGK